MKHTLKSLLITTVLTLPTVFGAGLPEENPSDRLTHTTATASEPALAAEGRGVPSSFLRLPLDVQLTITGRIGRKDGKQVIFGGFLPVGDLKNLTLALYRTEEPSKTESQKMLRKFNELFSDEMLNSFANGQLSGTQLSAFKAFTGLNPEDIHPAVAMLCLTIMEGKEDVHKDKLKNWLNANHLQGGGDLYSTKERALSTAQMFANKSLTLSGLMQYFRTDRFLQSSPNPNHPLEILLTLKRYSSVATLAIEAVKNSTDDADRIKELFHLLKDAPTQQQTVLEGYLQHTQQDQRAIDKTLAYLKENYPHLNINVPALDALISKFAEEGKSLMKTPVRIFIADNQMDAIEHHFRFLFDLPGVPLSLSIDFLADLFDNPLYNIDSSVSAENISSLRQIIVNLILEALSHPKASELDKDYIAEIRANLFITDEIIDEFKASKQ